jgi:ERF superfamily protein
MGEPYEGSRNLVQKLAFVMAAVERVPKLGFNSFHNYKYARESDLTDAVRANLAKQGVMLIPSVEKIEWREVQTKGGTERVATLTVRFTVTDGIDKLEFNIIGEGQDKGDKATYKAMTGAMKYALLKLFLIPTGDDPEKDGEEQEQQYVPANHNQRKADILRRLTALGITGKVAAKTVSEWIGREVANDTIFNPDDWSKADAGLVKLESNKDTAAATLAALGGKKGQ